MSDAASPDLPAAVGEASTGRGDQSDHRSLALAVFSVAWALAAMWHVLSVPVLASPASQALLAVGVAAAIARPGRRWSLVVLSVGVLVTAWSEAPQLANHWALAALVSIGIIAAAASTLGGAGRHDRAVFATRTLTMVRTCWLAFYAFAAFAKLNSAFFDRSVSCGVVYFDELTNSIGLGFLGDVGAPVDSLAIVATAVIEMSIPVLLVMRRTRSVGVVVALAFHGFLALDRAHVFVDFSSLLAAMYLCFLPVRSLAAGTQWVRERFDSSLSDSAIGRVIARVLAAGVPAGLVASVAARAIAPDALVELRWWSWQIASIALVGVVARHVWHHRPAADRAVFDLRPLALWVVPALIVLNGLTPYLELKTGFGWNMYANLRTAGGESNHFVVRSTWPLTDEQADLVAVVASDSDDLQAYAEAGYLLPWSTLRAYAAEHPEVALSYERAGEVVHLDRLADDPALVAPLPEWQRKLLPFRAVDASQPDRCQTAFLPLG